MRASAIHASSRYRVVAAFCCAFCCFFCCAVDFCSMANISLCASCCLSILCEVFITFSSSSFWGWSGRVSLSSLASHLSFRGLLASSSFRFMCSLRSRPLFLSRLAMRSAWTLALYAASFASLSSCIAFFCAACASWSASSWACFASLARLCSSLWAASASAFAWICSRTRAGSGFAGRTERACSSTVTCCTSEVTSAIASAASRASALPARARRQAAASARPGMASGRVNRKQGAA
mmetsp:Transcript_30646/g.82979  ORF Transcript_30646/g.82979 Transcript_30646/m.82979 type:complete len:237 (+) Transcript_30646:194-904(+)